MVLLSRRGKWAVHWGLQGRQARPMSPALHTGALRGTEGLGAQVPTSMGRGAQEGREGAHRAQGQEGPAQTMSLTLRGGERRERREGVGGSGGEGGVWVVWNRSRYPCPTRHSMSMSIPTTPGGWRGLFLPTIPSSQCAVWYRPKHRHKEVNTVFPNTEKVSRIYSIRWQKRMTFIGPFLRPFYGAKTPP